MWRTIVAMKVTAFFMLNSTEHEISTAHKMKMLKNSLLALKCSDTVFIQPINVKMPTIVGILTFMSWINFMFRQVEHEKSCITGAWSVFLLF